MSKVSKKVETLTYKQGLIVEGVLEGLNAVDERVKEIAVQNMKLVNPKMEKYRVDYMFLKMEFATPNEDGDIVKKDDGTFRMKKQNEIDLAKKHLELLDQTFDIQPFLFPPVNTFVSASPLTLVSLEPFFSDTFKDDLYKLMKEKRIELELKSKNKKLVNS